MAMKTKLRRNSRIRVAALVGCIPLALSFSACGAPSTAQKIATEKATMKTQFANYANPTTGDPAPLTVVASGVGSQTIRVDLRPFMQKAAHYDLTLVFGCPLTISTHGSVFYYGRTGQGYLEVDAGGGRWGPLCNEQAQGINDANTLFGARTKIRINLDNKDVPWLVGAAAGSPTGS